MLKRILSRGELIAVGMMAFLSLILGGWQIMLVAVLAGILIGLAAPTARTPSRARRWWVCSSGC